MGFLKKLFGGMSKGSSNEVEKLVSETLEGLLERSGLDLTFKTENTIEDGGFAHLRIEFSGGDEELLKDRKGQMLDAFQLFLKRVSQHHFPEDKTNISVDCGGYREENEAALIERAESLKNIAIDEGKSVYYRALPPKERKIVHQYLAKDPRVKSRSLGDGLYKKIKIYPAKNAAAPSHEELN
jgi:spoIIIJ-associated protein